MDGFFQEIRLLKTIVYCQATRSYVSEEPAVSVIGEDKRAADCCRAAVHISTQ